MPKKVENAKSKNLFNIQNKSVTEAEIIIYGPIGDSFWDDSAVSAKQFSDELSKLPATINKIVLRLNSPGGSVFDGMAIYERLKQHKATIEVRIDGIAASIASIIAQAGDSIIIGEGSMMMIHKPSTGLYGNRDDFEKVIRTLDKIEEQMTSIYARKSGMARGEISIMLEDDYWMTAEEAIQKGFATDLAGESENLRVAASMVKDAKWINMRKAPEIKDTKLVKKRAGTLNNNVNEILARLKNAASSK